MCDKTPNAPNIGRPRYSRRELIFCRSCSMLPPYIHGSVSGKYHFFCVISFDALTILTTSKEDLQTPQYQLVAFVYGAYCKSLLNSKVQLSEKAPCWFVKIFQEPMILNCV